MQRVVRYGAMPMLRCRSVQLTTRPLLCALRFNLPVTQLRSFHSAPVLCAKKKNDKKNAETMVVELPDMKGFDSDMERRLEHLMEEFSHIRPGRTSPDMFNHVVVEGHGGRVPMAEVGQITLKGTTRVTVNVFDPLMAPAVAKALRDCGMNLNPVVEGASVNITMPKASSEARDNLMKLVSKAAEKTKQEVQQVRKNAMDSAKKIKSSIGEDEFRKFTKDIDALTEKKVQKLTKLVKDKEKEING